MLSPAEISDLIHCRLPEPELKERLLALTPEAVDETTFSRLLSTMVESAEPFPSIETDVIDCCGTGGSGQSHYNTSTSVAFILAAGGLKVIKFGNRGMTSKSGSFDFLEALGIPPEIPLETIPESLENSGLVFLYAPQCYPALGQFNQLRRSVGVKTIFNFMGPLLNPAKPAYKLLGISSQRMQSMMADWLSKEPYLKRALLVHGENNLDEITPHGKTEMLHIEPNLVIRHTFTAPPLMQTEKQLKELNVKDNLEIFKRLVNGQDTSSIFHRMVCLNAGAGFWITGTVSGIEEGAILASNLLSSRKILETLEKCRREYAHHSR